jgi:hypothetical protein
LEAQNEIVSIPIVELLIYRVIQNKLKKKPETEIRRIFSYLMNESTFYFYDETRAPDILPKVNILLVKGINVIGFQNEHTSVYGKKIELAFNDINDYLWNNIKSRDLIIIRTFKTIEEREVNDSIDFLNILETGINLETFNVKMNKNIIDYYRIDFMGFITTTTKDIGTTEQFKIVAVDFIKMLQQINVSVKKNVIMDNTYSYDILNFYALALQHQIRKQKGVVHNYSEYNIDYHIVCTTRGTNVVPRPYLNFTSKPDPKIIDKVFIYQTVGYERTSDINSSNPVRNPFIFVYNTYCTPIGFVKLISNYIFDLMHMGSFFDVTMDYDDVADAYARLFVPLHIKKVKSNYKFNNVEVTPFSLINIYMEPILDEKKVLPPIDLLGDKIYDEDQFTKSLIMYSINKFPVLETIGDKDQWFNYIYRNFVFPTVQPKPKEDDSKHVVLKEKLINFESIERMLNDIYTKTRMGHVFDKTETNHLKTFVEYNGKPILFNDFVEKIDTDSPQIRSTKFNSPGSVQGFDDSIPLSQLISLGFSLYNNTSMYGNAYNGLDHMMNSNVSNYNYLTTISQVTWMTSIVVKNIHTRRPTIIIKAMLSPLLIDIISHDYKQFNKKLTSKTLVFTPETNYSLSKISEMEFSTLSKREPHIFFHSETPHPDDVVTSTTSNMNYIFYDYAAVDPTHASYSNENVRFSMNSDVFSHHVLMPENKNSWYLFERSSSYTWDKYIDFNQYVREQLPHIFYRYLTGIVSRSTTSSDLVLPANSRLETYDTSIIRTDYFVSGTTTLKNSITLPREFVLPHNVEINQMIRYTSPVNPRLTTKRLYLEYAMPKKLMENKIDFGTIYIGAVGNFIKTPGSIKDISILDKKLLLPYQLIMTPNLDVLDEKSNPGEGSNPNISDYNGTSQFYVTGIHREVNISRLESIIETLFHRHLLQEEIKNRIFIMTNTYSFDPSTLNYTYNPQELYGLNDLMKYMKELAGTLRTLYGRERIPTEVYVMPHVPDIIEYLNTRKLISTNTVKGFKFEGKENEAYDVYLNNAMDFLRDIIKFPKLINLTDFDIENKLVYKIEGDKIQKMDMVTKQVYSVDRYKSPVKFTVKRNKLQSDSFPFDKFRKVIIHLNKLFYAIDTFVREVIRGNQYMGSIYVPCRGWRKTLIGTPLVLINDRINNFFFDDSYSHLLKARNEWTMDDWSPLKKLDLKGKIDVLSIYISTETQSTIVIEGEEKFNELYALNINSRIVNQVAFYVWKTITYIGDATTGKTGNYMQKIYLSRDAVNHIGFGEEEDYLTSFVSNVSFSKYSVIQPPGI